MSTTLTQRYVAATIKGLSPETEKDVRAELEVLIADAIEAQVELGEKPDQAERKVLTELGDPAVLAASYADRPLHLIGPRYYLTWLRLLKLLLIIVPVTAVGGVTLAQVLAGASIGETIGQMVSVGISVAVHIAFWLTLVFVILERSGADTGVSWNVDQLPERQDDGAGRNNLIASLVFLGIMAVLLVWDRFVGFLRLDGESLPVLSLGLWPWAAMGLLALLAAEAVQAILVYRAGRRNTRLAVFNTVLAILVLSVLLTALGRGLLFNPEFIAAAFTDQGVTADTLRTLGILTGFAIVGVCIGDIVDGWRKAARAVE